MADELIMDSKALIFATLADVYLSSGMIDEAISILKDGLARNPNYTLGKIMLGRAYYLKGDIDEALKILKEIYELARDSETENLYLGHCYKKKGDYEKAITHYQAVLKINPENREASAELEILKPQKKEPTEETMIAPFEKAIPEPVALPREEISAPTEDVKLPSVEEFVAQTEEPPKEPSPVKEETIEATLPLPELGLETIPTKPAELISPMEALNEPMRHLLEIKSVKGSFILSRDGLLIQNYYQGRTDLEEIGALIAGIFNEAEDAFKFLKCGQLEKCIIEKKEETICVITAGESLLCIITQPEAKPGLVFLYARKIIEEIRKVLG